MFALGVALCSRWCFVFLFFRPSNPKIMSFAVKVDIDGVMGETEISAATVFGTAVQRCAETARDLVDRPNATISINEIVVRFEVDNTFARFEDDGTAAASWVGWCWGAFRAFAGF